MTEADLQIINLLRQIQAAGGGGGGGGAPALHAATHAIGGTDPVTIAQSQVTGLTTGFVPTTRSVNGHALSADVTVTADDLPLLLVKPAVAVVAVANLALTGEQTIDGVTTSTSLVLCTAQSTASQNGPWISAAGAWARPAWYANGSTTQAPQFLTTFVRLGTTYAGSTWRMTTASVTIGTTSQTWAQTLLTTASLPVDTDGTFAANSDLKLATQKAAKTYSDLKVLISAPVLSALPTGSGVASAATASTLVARDSSGNINVNSSNFGYATTATAAGTTTLTVADKQQQYFTGTQTQTVVLPVTSTLVLGQRFFINNSSTQPITVQSSGANTILAVGSGCQATLTCILTSGTSAASWNASLGLLLPMTVYAKSMAILAAGTPADLATIIVPFTRWYVRGSTAATTCAFTVNESQTATLATASLSAYEQAAAGGTQLLAANTLPATSGPTINAWPASGVAVLSSSTTLVVRQTIATAGGATGTASAYITIYPAP